MKPITPKVTVMIEITHKNGKKWFTASDGWERMIRIPYDPYMCFEEVMQQWCDFFEIYGYFRVLHLDITNTIDIYTNTKAKTVFFKGVKK